MQANVSMLTNQHGSKWFLNNSIDGHLVYDGTGPHLAVAIYLHLTELLQV